jgi:uncharacterized membrane protein
MGLSPARRIRHLGMATGEHHAVSDVEPGPDRPHTLRTVRLEAFSDGVFAIAITLLVLEIAVPADSADDLLGAVLDEWPSYLGYLVSFATIGAVWLAHTAVTELVARADANLVRLNLLLLLVVSFIPFPTGLLAAYVGQDQAGRVSTTIYGITLFVGAVLMAVLWRYALKARLVRPDAADESVALMTRRLTPGLAGYLAMIALGLFLPVLAVLGYLAIAVFFIVPFGLLRHRTA